MTRPRRFAARLVAFFALVVALGAVAPAGPQTFVAPTDDPAAWLFDSSKVVRIDLSIPDASRAALADDPYEYVNATFALADGAATFGPWPVKLKLKGRVGSFRGLDGKAAFKLKFGAAAQRVGGLKKLTLNNMVQDPSCVHETLAYELFRAMGVPAPRTGYAVVTVDGADFGLHLNVETLDDVALAKWYGAGGTKHLYEGSYGDSTDPADPFGPHYEVDEGDDDDRADLSALIAASRTEGDGWRAAVEAVADLREMTRMWAVERYVAHWDGYSGRFVSNYYLHSDASDAFTLLPWGADQTFEMNETGRSFGDPTGGVLFARCLRDPVARGWYADALAAARDKAVELGLATKAESLFASLSDEIDADTRREHDFALAVETKDDAARFLAGRPAAVAAWLAAVPTAPETPSVVSGDRRATLVWTPPSAMAPTVRNGYRVQHRRGGAPWTQTDVLDPAATGVAIDGLENGVRYAFRVGSLSSRGAPKFGRTVSAVVGGPPAATLLAARRATSPDRVELVVDAGDDAALRFDVQYRRPGVKSWRTLRRRLVAAPIDADTRVLAFRGLSMRRAYEFRVRPVNRYAAGPWTSAARVGP